MSQYPLTIRTLHISYEVNWNKPKQRNNYIFSKTEKTYLYHVNLLNGRIQTFKPVLICLLQWLIVLFRLPEWRIELVCLPQWAIVLVRLLS